MNLKDKTVVITGAGSGLGLALAKEISVMGGRLVLSARTAEESEHLCKNLECVAIAADVTSETEVRNLAQQALEKWGRIDVWINNAGVWIPYAPAETVSIEDYRKLMEVNYFGLVYGSLKAAEGMKKQREGTIVNILSVRPLNPKAGSAAYCASKSAAIGFTKTLRLELEPSNVSVFGVYPSGMRTHLFDEKVPQDFQEYMDPEIVAKEIVNNLISESPEADQIISKEKVEVAA